MPKRLESSCTDGCKHFTKLGSNQWQTRWTCTTCGHFTTQDPNERDPEYSPRSCPHEDTDHRGSTKDEVQTYCKQCKKCIDTRERAEYLRIQKIAHKLQVSSLQVINLTSTLLSEDSTITKRQLSQIISQFLESMGSYLESEDETPTIQIKEMLDLSLIHI